MPTRAAKGERNEGARQLAALSGNQEEIARKCGVTQGTVSFWRSSTNKPGYENRQVLQARFGIPTDAWDQRAEAPVKGAA